MPELLRTATFAPGDALPRILEDLVCPACGYEDADAVCHPLADEKLRIFCDRCGVFITVVLSDEQIAALRQFGR